MTVLADANIQLHFVELNAPEHALLRDAVRALTAKGERLCFASQDLVEIWNVCIR